MATLFIDLDGTLAKFYEHPMFLEKMYESGYFANLNPYENVVQAIRLLFEKCRSQIKKKQFKIIFHTAYPAENKTAVIDKLDWIKRHFRDMPYSNIIFSKCPSDKVKVAEQFLGRKLKKTDFLLDDYSKNLKKWVSCGGTGIKCVNEVQNAVDENSFNGLRIKYTDDPQFICNQIAKAINEAINDTAEDDPSRTDSAIKIRTETYCYKTFSSIRFCTKYHGMVCFVDANTQQLKTLPTNEVVSIEM